MTLEPLTGIAPLALGFVFGAAANWIAWKQVRELRAAKKRLDEEIKAKALRVAEAREAAPYGMSFTLRAGVPSKAKASALPSAVEPAL